MEYYCFKQRFSDSLVKGFISENVETVEVLYTWFNFKTHIEHKYLRQKNSDVHLNLDTVSAYINSLHLKSVKHIFSVKVKRKFCIATTEVFYPLLSVESTLHALDVFIAIGTEKYLRLLFAVLQ